MYLKGGFDSTGEQKGKVGEIEMNKELKTKLTNVLKAEADYVLKNEKDKKKLLSKGNDILCMGQIIDNFDELEPVLKEFFNKKAEKDRFDR